MCGIVAATHQTQDIVPCLLKGLKRLEYRGYDSAGLAVMNDGIVDSARAVGKVSSLEALLKKEPLHATVGIAHTRWATHGVPSIKNAHPQRSEHVAVVHNGIIENDQALKNTLIDKGYVFVSDTDTEVIAHLLDWAFQEEPTAEKALSFVAKELKGAYSLAILHRNYPQTLFAIRSGSPLVIGCGKHGQFLSSDALSLHGYTDQFIYLQEGDIAQLTPDEVRLYDAQGHAVERAIKHEVFSEDAVDKGSYAHFMLKEIEEQPEVVETTAASFDVSPQLRQILEKTKRVHIVACGTSYHAGLIAAHWFAQHAALATQVLIASEYRYTPQVVEDNTLFITLSQSGETADTLAALRLAKERPYIGYLSLCNVAHSSLVREADLTLLTHAGREIGVASTKAFSTQLILLLQLAFTLKALEKKDACEGLMSLGQAAAQGIQQALENAPAVAQLAKKFVSLHSALYLGRAELYPIALEGALKLKEISYIHAEAYPAGELKHGPLALVDDRMMVVTVVNQEATLSEKIYANLQEIHSRSGQLVVVATKAQQEKMSALKADFLTIPEVEHPVLLPLVVNVVLQLLAYHVALEKGTDVDQPRNLAKSVTVE